MQEANETIERSSQGYKKVKINGTTHMLEKKNWTWDVQYMAAVSSCIINWFHDSYY